VGLFGRTKIRDGVQAEATVVSGDTSAAAEALGYQVSEPPPGER
jgi:hypothetical protein